MNTWKRTPIWKPVLAILATALFCWLCTWTVSHAATKSFHRVVVPPYAITALGTTPAEINAKYPAIIEANLTAATLRAKFASLTDREMSDLALDYRKAKGSTLVLDQRVAASATVADKARWTKAKAGTLCLGRCFGSLAGMAVSQATYHVSAVGATPSPTLDMTLRQVYTEFRTAGAGLSVRTAAYETLSWVSMRASGAFGIGYGIGSAVYYVVDRFMPASYASMLDSIQHAVQVMATATTVLTQQNGAMLLAQLMGYQSLSGGRDAGDYKVAGAYCSALGNYAWYPGGQTAWSSLKATIEVVPCLDEDTDPECTKGGAR